MTSRAEVAKQLRELQHKTYYREEIVENITDAISISDPVNTFREPEDVYELLADLIDPTCKYLPIASVTWVDDNDEEHEEENLEEPGYSENAYCSICNYEMMTGEEGWFDYEREEHGNRLIPNFNYCPNCGARVVRDEA